MKKRVFGKKLSRSRPTREALFASLARSFILSGKIKTTKVKAKAVQGEIERIATLVKRGGLAERRRVLAKLDNKKDVTNFLFQKVSVNFLKRSSGFTRIIPLPSRRGDNAPMVNLEWTDQLILEEQKKSAKSDNSKKAEKVSKTEKTKSVKVAKTKKAK